MQHLFDISKPAQTWENPDDLIVTEDGKRIKELSTVEECLGAIKAIKVVHDFIEQHLIEQANTRVKDSSRQRWSKPQNPELLARLHSHRRNVRTALHAIDLRRGAIARVVKQERKARNVARNQEQQRYLLSVIKELHPSLYEQAVEEAKRLYPNRNIGSNL